MMHGPVNIRYSVDLTDQPENISNVKSNIVLHVDFSKAVSDPSGSDEGTICTPF